MSSEHLADHLHEHDHPGRRRLARDPDRSAATPMPTNSAMAALLGRRVDRAATTQQGAGPLDDEIASDIGRARGGGNALDDDTRSDMEAHLGTDLSGVRVHTGGEADNLSRSVQAEAFTTGSDIFFRSGKYEPSSTDGRRLLAHELTHVVQQSSGQGGPGGRVSHPDDPHEREAAAVGDAVANSAPAPAPAPATPATPVARAAAPGEEEEVARAAAPGEEEEVARAAASEEEEEVARAAAPEEEEEVARAAASEEEEEVARAAAPEEEEEVARAAGPEGEEEEQLAG